MSFMDSIKHALVEDAPAPVVKTGTKVAAPTPAPSVQPGGQPPAQPGTFTPYTATSFSPSAPAVDPNDDIYKSLVAKTDFDTTQAGQTLHKYLDPLSALPLDEKTKFKTAVVQAAAQEQITAEKIIATFDGLLVTLQHEADAFQQTTTGFIDREVTARQQKITELTQQMQGLQQQIQQLTDETYQAQQKLQTASFKFKTAYDARTIELTNQKAKVTGLLQ